MSDYSPPYVESVDVEPVTPAPPVVPDVTSLDVEAPPIVAPVMPLTGDTEQPARPPAKKSAPPAKASKSDSG